MTDNKNKGPPDSLIIRERNRANRRRSLQGLHTKIKTNMKTVKNRAPPTTKEG
jgi:hypothetical protein